MSKTFTPKQIIITEDHRVFKTASQQLAEAMHKIPITQVDNPKPEGGDIVLALPGHPLVSNLISHGITSIHDEDPARDPFHVFVHNDILWIIGGSYRGLMNGVHLVCGAQGSVDLKEGYSKRGIFALTMRIHAPSYGFYYDCNVDRVNLREWIRNISRMGASHIIYSNDFGGPYRYLTDYVASEIFPNATPEKKRTEAAEGLRKVIDTAQDFGLGVTLESSLMQCQGGAYIPEKFRREYVNSFPAGVFSDSGTHQGQVLCFSHPMVQDFHAECIRNFCAQFPEVDSMHIIYMDCQGEFCSPEACPRCRGLTKFDQRDRISRFYSEHLQRNRPGFKIFNSGHQWHRTAFGDAEMLTRQGQLPESVGLSINPTNDCATFESQAHNTLREARGITSRSGQMVLGRDAFHAFEDHFLETEILGEQFDYPFGIFRKIRRWVNLGFDGIHEPRGRAKSNELPAFDVNSIALRQALLTPEIEPEEFLDTLSRALFGDEAGPNVYSAWRLLDRAQKIRSQGFSFPSGDVLSEYSYFYFQVEKRDDNFVPLVTDPNFTSNTSNNPLGELCPSQANGHLYHKAPAEQYCVTGEALWNAQEILQQCHASICSGLEKNVPEMFDPLNPWINSALPETPSKYLNKFSNFVKHQQIFWAAMAPVFVLKGLRCQFGEDLDAFNNAARLWQERYVVGYRDLAAFYENSKDDKQKEGFKRWVHGVSLDFIKAKADRVEEWLKNG